MPETPTASDLEKAHLILSEFVVNLNVGARANPASDCAISVAAALDAHLTGIIFLYGPIVLPLFCARRTMAKAVIMPSAKSNPAPQHQKPQ
jgi:hypothetical protein